MSQRPASTTGLVLAALLTFGTAMSSTGNLSGSPLSQFSSENTSANVAGAKVKPQDVAKTVQRETRAAAMLVQCSGEDDTAALMSADNAALAQRQWVVIASGQTCASGDVTMHSLRIEKGGLLKPLKSHTITLSDNFEAGSYQVFINGLAGEGTVSFAGNASVGSVNPLWWAANAKPGTTDMTAAIQAAINATGGRGRVLIPAGRYLITDSLTLFNYGGGFSPLVVEGEGTYATSIITKASANRPAFLVSVMAAQFRNFGIWGVHGFPNDGIKITNSVNAAARLDFENVSVVMEGNGFNISNAHTVNIIDCKGILSGAGQLFPSPSAGGFVFSGTNAFVYVDLTSGFVNHLNIIHCTNEYYDYALYTAAGSGIGFNFNIEDNQFEGSTNGIKLKNIFDFRVVGNYFEGNTGYPIEVDNSRYGVIGPNHLNFIDYDSKSSAVKLNDVLSTVLHGNMTRLYITGTASDGVSLDGASVDRIQNEVSSSTRDNLAFVNSTISAVGVPRATLNRIGGQMIWYSDTVSTVLYPTVNVGDKIWKTTPAAGASPGWIATTASSPGPLVQVTGTGPGPIVLNYADPTAFDFRITMLSGGATGKATYKVEWKIAGGGSYADLTEATTTTELAHLVQREVSSATPTVTFQVKWPTGRNYVAGNRWTLTGVVAPVWTAIP